MGLVDLLHTEKQGPVLKHRKFAMREVYRLKFIGQFENIKGEYRKNRYSPFLMNPKLRPYPAHPFGCAAFSLYGQLPRLLVYAAAARPLMVMPPLIKYLPPS